MIVNFTIKRLCLASLLSVASLTAVNAQNSSVVLNGTNQYIDAGNNALLDATAIRTLECWVKFNNLGITQEILSRSVNSAGIELLLYNSDLNFFCMQSPSNVSYVHAPVGGLSVNTWYHIAATWDGLTKESMRLYINGVSVGTRTDFAGDINVSGITNPPGSTFRIGEWSDGGRPLAGTVDEVRVWSVTRTAAEIKAGMYDGIANNATGLSAYYRLNEGTGTTAANFAATGATLNGSLINTPTWAISPVQKLENGLNFDGGDDQVAIPANAAFDLTAGGTIEMWVQPSALSATPATLIGNRGAGGIRYSFDITSTTLGFRNNTARLTVANGFTNGTWYHLAFVYNGTTTVTAYVNGVLAGTFSQAITTGVTGQALTLGIGKTSGADVQPYAGNMDEVRIWNTQRTATEILNNMAISVNGASTGLVAVYGFNQGIANGANAGMLIAEDRTANNFHGTLVNFAVSGATSNWVSTTALALPVNLTYFTGARENDKVVLNWETAQEQNSRDFSIERSTDGVNYTAIGSVPAAGNSTLNIAYSFTDYAPEAGTNYYRLLQTDINGQFKYSKAVTIKFPLIAGVKIAPNPAVGTVYYTVNGLRQSQASVSITDMNGKKMLVRAITLQQGINRLSLDVSTLPVGNYTLQVTNTAIGQQTTEHLVIVR